jgi:ketosteroid isomerase-like protein
MAAQPAQDTLEARNVRAVQEAYAAFKADNIQELLKRFSNEIEWSIPGPPAIPFCGIRRGKEQVPDFFKRLPELHEVQMFDPREYIAEGDKVVVLGHFKAQVRTVRTTNRTMESDFVHVFTLRDGQAVQFREFADTAAALMAYKEVNT